jgi:hypothetical protein
MPRARWCEGVEGLKGEMEEFEGEMGSALGGEEGEIEDAVRASWERGEGAFKSTL